MNRQCLLVMSKKKNLLHKISLENLTLIFSYFSPISTARDCSDKWGQATLPIPVLAGGGFPRPGRTGRQLLGQHRTSESPEPKRETSGSGRLELWNWGWNWGYWPIHLTPHLTALHRHLGLGKQPIKNPRTR